MHRRLYVAVALALLISAVFGYGVFIQNKDFVILNGNLGVGTSTPAYPVDVVGEIRSTTAVRAPVFYDADNAGYYVDPSNTGTSVNVAGRITAGNVITSNSDPTYAPAVELRTWGLNKPDGSLYIEWGLDAGDALYITDHWRYTSPVYIRTGPISLMPGNILTLYAATNGNVGIGTTTPGSKLDVTGEIRGTTFRDRDNTTYYVDPSNTGTSVNVAGTVQTEGNVTLQPDKRVCFDGTTCNAYIYYDSVNGRLVIKVA